MITGNVSGPCMSGFYYVTALPKTNLYLLVIENYQIFKKSIFYNFNCRMTRRYPGLIMCWSLFRVNLGAASQQENG